MPFVALSNQKRRFSKIFFETVFLGSILLVHLPFAFSQSRVEVLRLDGSQHNNQLVNKRLFTTKDGLVSNDVLCGLQDSKGFIWIGTRNGLNRFDGKEFRLFDKFGNGLHNNHIIHLVEDLNGHLIIQYQRRACAKCQNTIDVLDLRTEKLIEINKAFPNMPFPAEKIVSFNRVGSTLYFGVEDFCIYKFEKNKFDLLIDAKDYVDVSNIDLAGGLFDLYANGAIFIHLGSANPSLYWTPEKIHVLEPKKVINNNPGLPYFFASNGELYSREVGKGGRIEFWEVDKKDGRKKIVDFAKGLNEKSNIPFNRDLFLGQNPSYISTFMDGDTLFFFVEEGYSHYMYSSFEVRSRPSRFKANLELKSTFIDSLGNYWVCTYQGLWQVTSRRNKFQSYFASDSLELGSQVRGMCTDANGNLFANVWTDISKSQAKKKVKSFLGGLSYAMLIDGERIYGSNMRLWWIDTSFSKKPNFWPRQMPMDVWALHKLSESEVMAIVDDIWIYHLDTKKIEIIANVKFPKCMLVYRFFEDNNKRLWVVAQNGLYSVKNKQFDDYYGIDAKDESHKLPCKDIHDVHQDDDGYFWIATNGEGLIKWDMRNNQFRHFSIRDGFPSGILLRIESDSFGNLWISTENGLCRFNTKTYKVSTFTTRDGISNNEFNRISSFKGNDGRLYFGGVNGINAFYPKDFQEETKRLRAPLHVISFVQFDGATNKIEDRTQGLVSTSKIILNPDDRFFEMTVQLLDFEEGHSRFAYKIIGLDSQWHYMSDNVLRLSGLPYGDYSLRVRAQNSWGQWSEKELFFPLLIVKPFYLRLWFLLGGLMVLVALFFIYVKWRVRKLKNDQKILRETVALRTKELKESLEERDMLLKELHHRVKNNFSLIQSLIYFQSINASQKEVSDSLGRLHQRIGAISSAHELIFNNYEAEFIGDGLEMNLYLHSVVKALVDLDNRDIVLDYHVQKCFLNADTCVPIGILVHELVSNSLKYANPKEASLNINITLRIGNDVIALFYHDNGMSFGIPARVNSLGMTIIESMTKQLKGKVIRENSHFQFILKVKKS